MDVATWNVNSIRAHLDHLVQWLALARPDVVCLQETKVVDALFPHAELEAAGYPYRAIHGQKTYNGVAILSRRPLADVTLGFTRGAPDEQARLIAATVDGVRIFGCYCPNGAPLGSEKYTYKLGWYERLHGELVATDARDVLVCGDFNVAPEDADVYDPFEADGQVLCTDAERAAWRKLVDHGLVDVYRQRHPFGSDYSWWDYRANGFRYNHGFRIDHVLLTPTLAARCTKVWIDRTPRAWDKASDHAPVLVTLAD